MTKTLKFRNPQHLLQRVKWISKESRCKQGKSPREMRMRWSVTRTSSPSLYILLKRKVLRNMVFNYGDWDWKELSGNDEWWRLRSSAVLAEGVNKKNLNEVAGVNLLETKTLSCWEGKIFLNNASYQGNLWCKNAGAWKSISRSSKKVWRQAESFSHTLSDIKLGNCWTFKLQLLHSKALYYIQPSHKSSETKWNLRRKIPRKMKNKLFEALWNSNLIA